jgi:hypothetical protein
MNKNESIVQAMRIYALQPGDAKNTCSGWKRLVQPFAYLTFSGIDDDPGKYVLLFIE